MTLRQDGCSFRPAINNRYAPKANFAERQEMWSMKRAEKDLHNKRKKEQLEIQECSFRPRTLHDSGSKLRSSAESLRDSIQRLYPPSQAKSKVAEQIELERERSDSLECTFAPNLALSMRSWKRQSSAAAEWADRSRLTQESVREPQPQGLPSEYTFHPAINKVPEKMEAAASYCRENVFDRLSAVPVLSESEGDDAEEAADAALDPELRNEELQEAFIDFLERQNFRNEVKEARMEKLRETVDPTFVPSLCDRSRRLAVAAKGRFGYTPAPRPPAPAPAPDPEARFQPRISRMAKRMPARKPEDLAHGDAQRLRLAAEARRARARDMEMAETTFAPALTDNAAERGRVRAEEAVETYCMRMRLRDEKLAQKLEQMRAAKVAAESSECTFTPKISQVPDYIVRMADASRAAKAVVAKPVKTRPEWR